MVISNIENKKEPIWYKVPDRLVLFISAFAFVNIIIRFVYLYKASYNVIDVSKEQAKSVLLQILVLSVAVCILYVTKSIVKEKIINKLYKEDNRDE